MEAKVEFHSKIQGCGSVDAARARDSKVLYHRSSNYLKGARFGQEFVLTTAALLQQVAWS